MDEKEKAALKLEALRAKLEALKIPNVQGGPAGAFVNPGGAGSTGEDMPPAIPSQEKGLGQEIAEFGVPAATSMYGAYRGAQAVAPLAAGATAVVGPWGGAAVTTAGAVAGAYGGGATGSLTIDGAKRALNLPGAPDAIDEYFANAKQAGSDAAWGEVWGQAIGLPLSKISPYRRAVDPESAALFDQQATRLRSAYERLSGTSMKERAWYNPMRVIKGQWAADLDEPATRRLIAQGVDPEAARSVALTGGLIPSEIEETSFSRMWGMVSNSKSVVNPDMHVYNQARTKLITEAALEDVGTSMTKMLPPEQVAEVVHGTLNGRVDTLTAGRRLSANAVGFNIPDSTRFNLGPLKKVMPAGIAGEDIVRGMPDNLPWYAVQEMRQNIGKMAHDELLDDIQRGQAKWLADRIDERVIADLPTKNLQKQYREFTKHDDAINAEGFNTAFVRGLLKENPAGMKAYANKIINSTDVGNYRKLERALTNSPGGPEILADIRGNISERFLSGAVKNGVIQPEKVILNLGTEARGQGRYFLKATLGPEYAQNWHDYSKVMDTVNDAARKSGHALGLTRSAATLGSVASLYKGGVNATDALYIGTAMYAPVLVAKVLTSPAQTKILMKVAANVAAGRNPKTTARLAMRLAEYAGYGPEDFFKGQGVLPSEQAASQEQLEKSMRGDLMPATGGAPTPVM
jgi:hypothetical protein